MPDAEIRTCFQHRRPLLFVMEGGGEHAGDTSLAYFIVAWINVYTLVTSREAGGES